MNFFSKKTSTTIAFKQTKQTFFYNYYEPLENTALDHCSEFTQTVLENFWWSLVIFLGNLSPTSVLGVLYSS